MNLNALRNAFTKTEDGTYDLNGNPVSFTTGYQFSIERPGKTRSDEFLEMIANATNGAYIGVWGGVKEISFHTDNYDQAMFIAQMFTQEAIWDWAKMEAITVK